MVFLVYGQVQYVSGFTLEGTRILRETVRYFGGHPSGLKGGTAHAEIGIPCPVVASNQKARPCEHHLNMWSDAPLGRLSASVPYMVHRIPPLRDQVHCHLRQSLAWVLPFLLP